MVPKTSDDLARSRHTREHRQPALGNLDADVLEVVDAGALDADEIVGVGSVLLGIGESIGCLSHMKA
jgi:hypothetical protein